MPEPGCSARWSASQASRCWAVLSRTTPSRRDSRSSEPRSTRTSVPSCSATSLGHPLVGGGGGGQHRDAVGQVAQQGADPAVVGPEVVAPVGDAVRLVDHEQPAGGGQLGQHLVAEAGVVQPLGTDQQDVDLTGADGVLDGLPVLDVGGVDGDGTDAGALGGGDLVAHQRQQRGDDHGRAGTGLAQQQGGDEVDGRLAPAGALHDQRATPTDSQRLDRGPLVVAQDGVVAAHQGAQVRLGLCSYVGRGGRGHGALSTSALRQAGPDHLSAAKPSRTPGQQPASAKTHSVGHEGRRVAAHRCWPARRPPRGRSGPRSRVGPRGRPTSPPGPRSRTRPRQRPDDGVVEVPGLVRDTARGSVRACGQAVPDEAVHRSANGCLRTGEAPGPGPPRPRRSRRCRRRRRAARSGRRPPSTDHRVLIVRWSVGAVSTNVGRGSRQTEV